LTNIAEKIATFGNWKKGDELVSVHEELEQVYNELGKEKIETVLITDMEMLLIELESPKNAKLKPAIAKLSVTLSAILWKHKDVRHMMFQELADWLKEVFPEETAEPTDEDLMGML